MEIIDDGTCFACGDLNEVGLHLQFDLNPNDASATTEVMIAPVYSGWRHAAHGGIVSTLLDEAMVYACGSMGWLVATARLSIRFRNPAPLETPLLLRGEVTRAKSRMMTAKGELYHGDQLLADAKSTMATMQKLDREELMAMRAVRSIVAAAKGSL